MNKKIPFLYIPLFPVPFHSLLIILYTNNTTAAATPAAKERLPTNCAAPAVGTAEGDVMLAVELLCGCEGTGEADVAVMRPEGVLEEGLLGELAEVWLGLAGPVVAEGCWGELPLVTLMPLLEGCWGELPLVALGGEETWLLPVPMGQTVVEMAMVSVTLVEPPAGQLVTVGAHEVT